MTHNEKVLALLSDGKPHSHRELYGLYVMGHSRVADLRKRGHDIRCWREGDLYFYELQDSVAGELDGERRPLGVSTATENLAQSLPLSGSASDPSGADRTRTLPQGTTVALAHAPAPLGTPLQLELTVAA